MPFASPRTPCCTAVCLSWLLALLLGGCAVLQPVVEGRKLVGHGQAEVRQTFGQPTDEFRLAGGGSRWIYSKQPNGRYAYAAEFDPQGRLVSFRQVLETNELNQAKVGTWTKQDVVEHFGSKAGEPVAYFARMDREVWSYRFLHDDEWPSLYNFYFDHAGVLRQTQVTPDPRYGRGPQF